MGRFSAGAGKCRRLIQFIKFNIVGVVNTGIDFAVLWLLTSVFFMNPTVAKVISYSCGVLNSYILNRLWTFRAKDRWNMPELLKFIAVNLVALGVATLVLTLCQNVWGMQTILANLVATPFSLIVNFLGNKLFIFKERP
ncbi:MAG: GtrA family protein [Christensenellales bacterium]|jgi:putative flippase GtrA